MNRTVSRAVVVQPGGDFERVGFGERAVPEPGPGEITVRLRASAFDDHDDAVLGGMWGPFEARVPLPDGAIDACGLRPVIDRRSPLEGLVDAVRHRVSDRHCGEICLAI